MSARRAVPKGSALPVAPEFAKQGGSRLDHVLSVGMSNAKLGKTAAVPAAGNNISFALAHKAPIVNVGISILRKTLRLSPARLGSAPPARPPTAVPGTCAIGLRPRALILRLEAKRKHTRALSTHTPDSTVLSLRADTGRSATTTRDLAARGCSSKHLSAHGYH